LVSTPTIGERRRESAREETDMAMEPFYGTTRREFLAGGLSLTMLAASAPRDAAEDPVIALVPGPEVDAFKKAQERLLAKDHVTARSRFAKLPEPPLTVHVLEGGKGDPVLLIHGGAAIAVQWSPLLTDLQREFHWYAPDRPGCGLTDKFDYSKGTPFEQHARKFVGGVMDALGLRRASLVGNSMGGYWALLFALAEPDRVDKLVLLGSPAASAPPDRRPPRPPAAPGPPSIEGTRAALRAWLVADVDRVSPEMLEASTAGYRLPGAQLSWTTMLASLASPPASGLTYALRPALKDLRAPTLFVWGDKDIEPSGLGQEMAALAPHARCEIVADAGHIVWLDQPERCSKLTIEFLKSV
jgi:pimeloyl-ACP methyl ester carboxylesterase